MPMSIPGINPALNIAVTDAPVATPKITIGIDGGIITPIEPAVATKAKVNFFEYPCRIISGMTIVPIAATVAGPEPETAAKNIQTITVTIANPPVIRPNIALQTDTSLEETPPALIKSPANINIGIARIGNESQDVTNCCVRVIKVILDVPINVAIAVEIPRYIPT